MTESRPIPNFPMSDTFRRAMGRRHFGMPLIFGGLLFIVLGIALVIEPRILLWVVALTFVGSGALMLTAAFFMRKLARRMRKFASENEEYAAPTVA
ncbi:MAG: hypothetical protein ACHQAY_15860 [Hyphomicrobiales bacterium]